METILINAIISICVAIIIAYFTARVTFYFKEKEFRNKLMIEKNYNIFINLRNNLKDFFTEVTEKYDFWGYLTKNKKLLKDIKNRLKTNFDEYSKKQEKEGLFCNYNKVELYFDYIKKFESIFFKDIQKITKLSPSNIKKVAIKIENIYLTAKKEECLLFESLQDELGQDGSENEKDKYSGYIRFKQDAYWGKCWLKILPLLKKLKNNIEYAADIKKISN